ncbi:MULTISPECIES: DUF6216 family protein [Pseudomonas]|uniref:DUF6216 family protein n=1 Tax=Pseudomonas TaxID=286 RepID=UPI001FF3D43E|nr:MULTISPECIES: DUF6216 family protein [Pseudomonas]
MTQSHENALSWPLENYATFTSIATAIFIFGFIIYIYTRSGSLLFLRDLFWRLCGGIDKFNDSLFEQMRKDLRELEYYRFEFNIPAKNLKQARLSADWILKNDISSRDVARARNYIDWSDFSKLKIKTKSISKGIETPKLIVTILFIAIAATTSQFAITKYLMVSLKNAPDVPSFYISEDNVKFKIFADIFLTPAECRSSASLEKFITPEFQEKNLDTICSFFIDSRYNDYVNNGLSQQRGLLLMITAWSLFLVFTFVASLTRLHTARALHTHLKSRERMEHLNQEKNESIYLIP